MGMDSLINSAICREKEEETLKAKTARIVVVGCGGAGNNSINRLSCIGVDSAETIAINTDQIHLATIEADKRILIGRTKTRGLGAGGRPTVGQECAEQAAGEIRQLLNRPDITFITVGLGGGTGTGSAHVVAKIAKQLGSVVIAIATTPFKVERNRLEHAAWGLERLRAVADNVIVLDNNRLLELVPNLPLNQAFSVMDQLIAEVIIGITGTINQPSLINLDFADFKAIMSHDGLATILYGECGEDEPAKAVIEALNNPLLDIDYTGASGALVHITGGTNLSLKTVHSVAEGITHQLAGDANVILGARIDPKYSGRLKVMAIITGVHSPTLDVGDRAAVRAGASKRSYLYDIPLVQ